jgi:hypothetical protein
MFTPELPASILEAAIRLAKANVTAVVPANAGANSRLYRIDTEGGPIALKSYPSRANDQRRRADVEWQTLTFLRANGVSAVPEPLAHDPDVQFLLMEWIEGRAVADTTAADIANAADFVAQIFALSAHPDAEKFSAASEACLSPNTIINQIQNRLQFFGPESGLAPWLDGTFLPAFEQARQPALQTGSVLPVGLRRLIPADFGFHNAIRQNDGRLRYIDFDYFGWDDPVKLAADTYLHPAMDLTRNDAGQFVTRMAQALPDDAAFIERFNHQLMLYALRWALIVLNPFRIDRLHELPAEDQARAELRNSRLGLAEKLIARGADRRP